MVGTAQAATLTVGNLNDSGGGSLRDALTQANATAQPDTVNFASGLTGTIHLASGLHATPYPVSIEGPGADKITISGENAVRDLTAGCFCTQAPSFSISGLTFSGGKATGGGAIDSILANLTISNSVISGNAAVETGSNYAHGGGVYAVASAAYPRTLMIDHSTISNNAVGSDPSGGTYGAGIAAVYESVVVNASTVSGNTGPTDDPYNFGGGLWVNHGSAAISSSTFANNKIVSGGGMRISNSAGPTTISDTTIANNTASYGGGIRWTQDNGSQGLTITGTTISGNGITSGGNFGGGIGDTADHALELRDSIVSGNTEPAGPDIYTGIPPTSNTAVNSAFSLIGSTAGANINETVSGSDIIGQNPQLGPLATNGGPVLTMALPATSPAVDRGKAFGLNADARGVLRPIDFPSIPNSTAAGADGADIGAFELQPSNALTLGKLKKNKKKGTAVQTVNLPVPDAGTVTLSGKGLKSQTKSAMATGVLKLKVIAKGKKKKALRRKGKAKVKETVTYNPTGQSSNALTKKFKLVKRPKRH